jgi:endo-1,4-beta-xylanase
MRKKILLTVTCAFTTLLFTSCSHTKNATGSSAVPSLKQTFKNDFLVGTALSAPQIEGRDTGAARLVPQQFNAATPENIMKAEIIHPGWDKYNFDPADKLVEYAKKNGIQVTAHTLIWHSQTPAFLRGIKD